MPRYKSRNITPIEERLKDPSTSGDEKSRLQKGQKGRKIRKKVKIGPKAKTVNRGGKSMWYCAHAIFYYKFNGQASFLIHENVYLINAENEDVAFLEAEKVAKENEDLNEDGHLYLNDNPAAYVFAGIRKLIEVETNSDTAQGKIISGIEVTYSEMEVDTIEEVVDLADGKFVSVLYRE